MNTKASVAYGWGVLVLAGGGAYYFAKRSINADRAERAAADERRRQAMQRMRDSEYAPTKSSASVTGPAGTKRKAIADRPDPSLESKGDPAPVTHAQEQMAGKGRYEAAEPFKSRKGDRFS